MLDRRRFLALAAAAPLAGTAFAAPAGGWLRKSVKGGMIDVPGGWLAKLTAAKAAGFDGVEPNTDPALDVEEFKKAALRNGVVVDGTVGGYHWKVRHTDPDAAVRKRAAALLEQSLRQTAALGADTFLIVPGHGKDGTRAEVEERAKAALSDALPLAEELGVSILIENVWNAMFYDPDGGDAQGADRLAAFVDSFASDRLGVQLDLGNHWRFGDVAEWVTTLGPRTKKLDIKGYSRTSGKFTDVTEGDIDWVSVRKALREVGYTGWVAAEVGGGDQRRLSTVADQIDAALHCDEPA